MTPPAVVLARLAASRRNRLSFDDAWPLALDNALSALGRTECEAWGWALTATREAWEAAYERQPATRRTRALAVIADDSGREPMIGRACERCDAPIPPGKRRVARYCSRGCQRAANGRSAVAA